MNDILNFHNLINMNDPELFDFQLGYVSGVFVAIAVICAVLIVKIILFFMFFYPRRSKGVFIPGASGSLFISANAITDLVRSLESDFKFIEISKVILFDRKKYNDLELHINFDMEGGELPSIASELQSIILSKLKDTFGIDNIKEVNIKIKRVTVNRNTRF